MTTQNQTIEVKVLGRKINENSARQIRLKENEAKRAQGLIKRGRPVIEGSESQVKKLRQKIKVDLGYTLRRGRPIVEGSESQIKKARQMEKLVNGVELRRGRPANTESKHYQRVKDLETRRMNGTLKLGRPKSDDIVINVKTKAKIKEYVMS